MAGYQKILILTDLSNDGERVIATGREIAAYSKAAVVLLHVVEFVPVEPMGETLMPTLQIEEELAARSRQRLAELDCQARARGRPLPGRNRQHQG